MYTAGLFAVSRPVGEVLERAGIGAIAGRRVGKCSGGEQQRLRFAMALIPDPQLLILDEPTQGMDVEGRRDFWKAVRDDAALGRTIAFATHYLEEADAYADRVVLISKGRIVADGAAAEVKGLAAGRTIRATLPGADEAALRAMPGVDGVEVRGDTVLIHSGDTDTDTVARRLLNQTAARDLEITSRGLEEAFIALTGDGAAAGYLLPSENVTQVIALALTLCSFAGGLFIPVSQFSPDLLAFAKFTPLYGLSQLVHYPLVGGTLQWAWILNLVAWPAIFVTGAVWRLHRDTARV
jgi:ABC-type proline/glycine betaine transport system ATPase subunit